MTTAALPGVKARIGPNAIIRVLDAMGDGPFARHTTEVLERAGLARYVLAPPASMVDENEVIALHRALRERLGDAPARDVAREAGLRTARYLLAHRIPGPVQLLLRWLPARAAASVLLQAIGRNAWTFAGSGTFTWQTGVPTRVSIERCPLARAVRADHPVCDYYAGTFEGLFRALVNGQSRVREVACEAMGDPACVFEIRWG